VVANQLLADNPPETWQTVQWLAGLGYDWHSVMHIIMRPVSDSVYQAMARNRPFDREEFVR
jgi:predicted DCC family thiol-disulfide oxidoreductase YuxK